jgi:hypothetical protein
MKNFALGVVSAACVRYSVHLNAQTYLFYGCFFLINPILKLRRLHESVRVILVFIVSIQYNIIMKSNDAFNFSQK